MELFGCGTALITPFCEDESLDEPSLIAQVDRQIRQGMELLIPCGTTGEAATLTDAEWMRVVELTCSASAGRVPVFAGCTHNSTTTAVNRARQVARVPGLTGLLTANPYYNRPGQQGQYEHFRAIAEAVSLPVLLYNIPGRTGANLEPATVVRLAEIENIVGIKESSGSLAQITELLTLVPRRFRVFAGDDALALPVLALGGAGLISVASNVVPKLVSEMVRATMRNDWSGARRMNRRLFPLVQALFAEPSPAPAKAAMSILGLGGETLRLPMVPVSEGLRDRLRGVLDTLGAFEATQG